MLKNATYYKVKEKAVQKQEKCANIFLADKTI